MATSRKKTVLVSPLDWGLGHATRCVPIIQALINHEVEVILGTSGLSGQWLKQTFPMLESVEVPFREISYHKWLPMGITAMMKYPSVRNMIAEEHQWIKEFTNYRKIDGIISDNRYGIYHRGIPSVCITHQLYIDARGYRLLQPFLNKLTHTYLKPFDEIWIPDFSGPFTLSGKLSHPPISTHTIKYIGPLSRFNNFSRENIISNVKYDVVFVISGPEPLRTCFEKRCIEIAVKLNKPSAIIRGTNKPIKFLVPSNCTVINLADTEQLFQILQQSGIIISRAGYSSIMDWFVLQKQAILIPTPGQTEQEYLAKHLQNFGLFQFVRESEFYVSTLLNFSHTFVETKQVFDFSNIIHEWLQKL
ncbi:MAG: glycosyltransferase [Flavobacteriales bacterium]|nr:glycosyltransferase [Flavobacteriales bacterium]